MNNIKVCFIGHRKVENKEKVFEEVKRVVKDLIKQEGVLEFLFGSNSEFDSICYEVVTSFMSSVPSIRRIRYTCISESCVLESERISLEKKFSSVLGEEIHLRGFEEEVHHKTRLVAGRASYIERNKAMIDDSDLCVFYYNENYKVPPKKQTQKDLVHYHPKSGTRLSYTYAKSKNKKLINIYETLIKISYTKINT